MQRFCVTHERDRGLGCDVEMVQSNVGEYVRFEDAQAEIAKLRADLTKAHQDGYAEGRKHRVAAVETHADEMHRAQEEIAKLRAERDEAKRTLVSLFDDTKAEMKRLRSALAAARAALDGEREACEAARRCVVVHEGRETGTNATAFAMWRRDHDARRAAEAKEQAK